MEYTSKLFVDFLKQLIVFDRDCQSAIQLTSRDQNNRTAKEKDEWVSVRTTAEQQSKIYTNKVQTIVADFQKQMDGILAGEISDHGAAFTRLQKYDLRNKIRDFMLYSYSDVEVFIKFMASQAGKNQDATALGRLSGMFKPVVARYMDLSEDDRYTARDYVRKFNKAYAFVTQLVRLHDRDLFNEYQFTLQLIRFLPKPGTEDIGNIEDKIKLEYASLTETFSGAIVLDEKPPRICSQRFYCSQGTQQKEGYPPEYHR